MTDVYYDPYNVEINADPYPVYRRLREEAPLYYNEQHDFYAVSRYEDVERGLLDAQTYISGKGGIIELIRANIEMPKGILIFEDPPTHTIHRRLLSRAFTPRRVADLEPKIREFCARSLDPFVGSDRFDFIADLGAQMPMRTIGMLLGIPEADQEAVRDHVDANLRTKEGQPMEVKENFVTGEMFADYVDWRAEHPSDDIMTELLNVGVRGRDRDTAASHPGGASHLHRGRCRRRQRDHDPPHRLDGQGAGRAPRATGPARRGSLPDPQCH